MIFRAIASQLVNRHVARRLARAIPHPGVRAVAVVLSSVLVSHLVEKALAKAGSKLRWSSIASRRERVTA